MDKEKLKHRLGALKTKLAFLKPWDIDDKDFREDLEIREIRTDREGYTGRTQEQSVRMSAEESRRRAGSAAGGLLVLVLLVGGGFYYYNSHHQFSDYVITSTDDSLDIEGSGYALLGKSIIKYSSDGVFCVDTHNTTKWSAAYSMQTPIIDSCENTMVIAEQQGKQVYVINEDGVLGNFETSLPILKAHVSEQGVTALILKDDDVTWVELYSYAGEEIAAIKATLQDYGYPLDVAITPDASRMMVSFLGISQGTVSSKLAFFDFSSSDEADESHMIGSLDYPGRVFPEVYYADASTTVALSDQGFVVIKDGSQPEEQASVMFEKEIISSFHDQNYVGFVFENDAVDCKYDLELYSYSGKRKMQKDFDSEYSQVRMDSGEILLYDTAHCTVYTVAGTRRFSSDYEKQIAYFMKLPEFRKYLVITDDSMDQIRIG